MNFTTYAEQAASTAIYPDRGRNLPYAALGIADEAGELLEAIGGLLAAGPDTDATAFLKEAGDVLWYVAAVAAETGVTLDGTLDELAALGDRRPFPWRDLVPLGARITIAASKIAGLAKKTIRDHDGRFPDAWRADVAAHLRSVLHYLGHAIATASDGTRSLDGAAEMNLAKLSSRKERGVLSGSGDDR